MRLGSVYVSLMSHSSCLTDLELVRDLLYEVQTNLQVPKIHDYSKLLTKDR